MNATQSSEPRKHISNNGLTSGIRDTVAAVDVPTGSIRYTRFAEDGEAGRGEQRSSIRIHLDDLIKMQAISEFMPEADSFGNLRFASAWKVTIA